MRLKIPQTYASIELIYHKVVSFAKKHHFDHANINIVLNEICSNIIKYSKSDKKSCIQINIEKYTKSIVLTISYKGVYFNPIKYSTPPSPNKFGNVGIHIVKSFASIVYFHPVDSTQINTLPLLSKFHRVFGDLLPLSFFRRHIQ